MPLIEYVPYKPKEDSSVLLSHCKRILQDTLDRGYMLTLRQLYYRLVSEDRIPNNNKSYIALKKIVSKAHDGGLLDWNYIQDRGRYIRNYDVWSDPRAFIGNEISKFAIDLWSTQTKRVEVWVEKEALVEVVSRPTRRWRVPYFVSKGYMSAAAVWMASQRFMRYRMAGQDVVILHLTDHDPPGLDMTRDITERLRQYSQPSDTVNMPRRSTTEIRRIALNFDQVAKMNLRPNPVKMANIRIADYAVEYGSDSWELDAIPAELLDKIVDDAIQDVIDIDKFEARQVVETQYHTELEDLSRNWCMVRRFMRAIELDAGETIAFIDNLLFDSCK